MSMAYFRGDEDQDRGPEGFVFRNKGALRMTYTRAERLPAR